MSTINLIEEALSFEQNYKDYKSRNEKIIASRKAKEFILSLNKLYIINKDKQLMDMMKRLTVIKQKVEKKLKGRV